MATRLVVPTPASMPAVSELRVVIDAETTQIADEWDAQQMRVDVTVRHA